MFNDSKYTQWYLAIISRAHTRPKPQPAEKHHVIPKCFKQETDLVYLTPREHFICHWLLTKMVSGTARSKMMWALHRMMFSSKENQPRYRATSRMYELFRKRFYDQFRGKPAKRTKQYNRRIVEANKKRTKGKTLEEQYGAEKATQIRAKHSSSRTGNRNGMYRKSHSQSTRQKIGEKKRGNNYGMVGENHPRFGTKHSEEHKRKISLSLKKVKRRHIVVDGIEYSSTDAAANALGMKYMKLYNQARSDLYPNVYFV